jgi:hypothetical protein
MVCLHAMGAYKINIVQAITKEMSLDEDYIMVEDRGNPSIPKRVMEHDRVCNVPWLKQCLVSEPSFFPVDPLCDSDRYESGQ